MVPRLLACDAALPLDSRLRGNDGSGDASMVARLLACDAALPLVPACAGMTEMWQDLDARQPILDVSPRGNARRAAAR
jgi:hypothetical protein